MKRLALITAAGFLTLTLVACGGEKDNKPVATDNAVTQPAQTQPMDTNPTPAPTPAPEGQSN